MKENRTMRIFSAIGILLIVAGHLNMDYFTIGGLFPYYSFHVYVFLFVAGYFYSVKDESDVKGFILRKMVRLLLPYYILHFIFGLISTLFNKYGIHVGGVVSFNSVVIDPFMGAHMFMLDFPGWFVPALFVVEIMNLYLNKLVKIFIKNYSDIVCFAISLLAGLATVYLSIGGHVWGWRQTPGRWIIMLFGIQLGTLFKNRIEPLFNDFEEKNKDKVLFIYFGYLLLIILIQLPIRYMSNGLTFSVVWCKAFANGPLMPFVTIVTGLSFWLVVSKIISLLKESNPVKKLFLLIGRNTFGIMMGHMAVLFFINSICCLVMKKNGTINLFDLETYKADVSYQYLYAGWHVTHMINFLLCVSIALAISLLCKKLTKRTDKN